MNSITRISAVDLRELSDEEMVALSREAMRQGIPIQVLYGQLIEAAARKILNHTDSSPRTHRAKPRKAA